MNINWDKIKESVGPPKLEEEVRNNLKEFVSKELEEKRLIAGTEYVSEREGVGCLLGQISMFFGGKDDGYWPDSMEELLTDRNYISGIITTVNNYSTDKHPEIPDKHFNEGGIPWSGGGANKHEVVTNKDRIMELIDIL